MRTVEQVALILQISLSLVYREIHTGRLVAHRFGERCYRISEEDLAKYVSERALRDKPRIERPELGAHRPVRFGQLRHLHISRPLDSQN
jgi:excisionase family DNA binding protein